MSAGVLLCAPHPSLGWAAHTHRSPLRGDEVIPDSEHHSIWAHSHWVHGLCIWAISPGELRAGFGLNVLNPPIMDHKLERQGAGTWLRASAPPNRLDTGTENEPGDKAGWVLFLVLAAEKTEPQLCPLREGVPSAEG